MNNLVRGKEGSRHESQESLFNWHARVNQPHAKEHLRGHYINLDSIPFGQAVRPIEVRADMRKFDEAQLNEVGNGAHPDVAGPCQMLRSPCPTVHSVCEGGHVVGVKTKRLIGDKFRPSQCSTDRGIQGNHLAAHNTTHRQLLPLGHPGERQVSAEGALHPSKDTALAPHRGESASVAMDAHIKISPLTGLGYFPYQTG